MAAVTILVVAIVVMALGISAVPWSVLLAALCSWPRLPARRWLPEAACRSKPRSASPLSMCSMLVVSGMTDGPNLLSPARPARRLTRLTSASRHLPFT